MNAIEKQISFSIRAETACTRGEAGYFELQNSNGVVECIKLPEVSFTFTPSGGVESSVHDGDPDTVIKIKFDSTISYVGSGNTSNNLSKQNILEMLEVRGSSGADFATSIGSIGADQVSFSSSNSGTTITINPPNGLVYPTGSYTVSFGGFAKSSDASKVISSSNRSAYLNTIGEQIFFFCCKD